MHDIKALSSLSNAPAGIIELISCLIQIVSAEPPQANSSWQICCDFLRDSNTIKEINEIYDEVVNAGALLSEEHLSLTNLLLSQYSYGHYKAISMAAADFYNWLVKVSKFDVSKLY